MRIPWIFLTCLTCATAHPLVAAEKTESARRPNFVFFLVDDLGWADLGCFGSTFYETPNIDRLCASGMKFTSGYAACPVCSPTRASIMTGRHPVRVDITDWIPGMSASRAKNAKLRHVEDRDNLAIEEVTIAEALKQHGYQTFFAGKWHLGGKGHWPTDQGFDLNVGGCEKGSPPGGYYAPWNNPNLKAKNAGEYLTERLTDESVAFLEKRNMKVPFLLYLSYYNVHTPITPYKKRYQHFQQRAAARFQDATPVREEHEGMSRLRQDNPAYASMIAAVDDSVGRILAKLDDLKLASDTVVFFFSDNGGLSTLRRIGPTCNLPLRAGKGWLYEGGVREPMIIRAPGVTRPGSVCNTPVVSMDFFPTMLELAGLPAMPEKHADGVSLAPLLKGGKTLPPRTLFWHYPHYHGSTWTPGASIREGDWKLIEFYHWDKVELYNLKDDVGEQHDLSEKNPAKAAELLDKLHSWQRTLGAKMPQPIPPQRATGDRRGSSELPLLDQETGMPFLSRAARFEARGQRLPLQPGVSHPGLESHPHQGHDPRRVRLGCEGGPRTPADEGRPRPIVSDGSTVLADRGPQSRDRRDQVLRLERFGKHAACGNASRGLRSMARGKVVRAGQAGMWVRLV